MTVTIEQLARRLESLPATSVVLGDELAWRFSTANLTDEQVGHSVSSSGDSLVTGEPGSWQATWLVIGRDGLGDPFFVDASTDELPVFTAAHGAGSWEPERVADSLDSLCALLRIADELQDRWRERKDELDRLLRGLTSPEQLEGDVWKEWKARVRDARQIKKDVSAARTAVLQEVEGKAARWWRDVFARLNECLADAFELIPNSKQDGCFVIGQNHADRHKPEMLADARFSRVILCGDYHQRFGVAGAVATAEDAAELRRGVDATEPPFPVYFSVRVAPE